MNRPLTNLSLTIAVMLLVLLQSCGLDTRTIRGDGQISSSHYELESFNAIQISGMYNIALKQSDEPGLSIETDENLMAHIKVVVKDQTLYIETEKDILYKPTKMELTIQYPELHTISSSGACKIKTLEALQSETLRMDISGACSMDLELNVEHLFTQISGAGSIHLTGLANHHQIDLSGAASLKAEKLKTLTTIISLSGAGSALVNASDKLNASISGVGSVKYSGNPSTTNFNTSGLGSIKPM